jgi:hypothetical protein
MPEPNEIYLHVDLDDRDAASATADLRRALQRLSGCAVEVFPDQPRADPAMIAATAASVTAIITTSRVGVSQLRGLLSEVRGLITDIRGFRRATMEVDGDEVPVAEIPPQPPDNAHQ